MIYVAERGWLDSLMPRQAFQLFYTPEIWAVMSTREKYPQLTAPYEAYVEFFERLGRSHKHP